jgi:glyoxylase-like metal-dependent hydrolase (beta-lactamase superfamily II)
MYPRTLLAFACASTIAAFAWFTAAEPKTNTFKNWEKIADGIYRTKSGPHVYALIEKEKVLLIDAAAAPEVVDELGAKTFEAVLLTHHHRDAVAHAAEYRKKGISVRAPKESADWLAPEKVTQFWKDSLPLRNSRTAYFVVPEGIEGIEYSISDGAKFAFGKWQITPIATPGHSRDHFAYLCESTEGKNGPSYLFSGDAFTVPGKLWTPFTTDWDHWTDIGLKPTAASLRKMANLEPSVLCPAHGAIIDKDVSKALNDTATAVDEAAFMKSYERYTKDRLGDAPKYEFLVPKEQIASAGDKPWAKVSDHLWITGNTYVLKSTNSDGILVLDPWGQRSADQIEKLRMDQKLGPIEVVAFSHAHYDHFDGIHVLNGRDRCEVWGLDLVAIPLKDPLQVRAPFLDPRPIKFTKTLKDGETAAWGGYAFKFHHLPGQSWYTSGIEVTLDGKRCLFTADNFFHQDQFSGTGGWMGLNRSSPAVYGTSAKKVFDIAPEWVLAEHGGPYVFHKEDYRRRVKWGEAAGKAADALCLSGNHLRDWTPHRVTVEPVLQQAKPGTEVTVRLSVEGTGRPDDTTTVTLRGRGMFPDIDVKFDPKQGIQSKDVKIPLPANLRVGQHVFIATVQDLEGADTADPYFAVSVQGP